MPDDNGRMFDDEMAAWDHYAASALVGLVGVNDPVFAETTAADAAKLADALLEERRKRRP